MAILEWKANYPQVFTNDVAWLSAFSAGRPTFTGYAVSLDLKQRNFRSCALVFSNKARSANGWFVKALKQFGVGERILFEPLQRFSDALFHAASSASMFLMAR